MNLYGLIGKDLSHSFSRKYFLQKFENEKISNSDYQLFPLESIEQFPDLIKDNPNLIGLNITIPYKTEILKYVDYKSNIVNEINACNTIFIKENKIYAENTDIIGFEKSLLNFIDIKNISGALILGSGGASKAIAYILKKLNIEFKIISRKDSQNHISYNDLNHDIISNHNLIINTTPLGTFPNNNEFPPINYELIRNNHYLFDLIYNPELTKFLEFGKSNGAKIINGYEMLKLQAEESWKIWQSQH